MMDAAASVSRRGDGAQGSELTGFLIVGSAATNEPLIEGCILTLSHLVMTERAIEAGLPSTHHRLSEVEMPVQYFSSIAPCLWSMVKTPSAQRGHL